MEANAVPIRVLCRVRPLTPNEHTSEFVPVLYDDNTSISLSGRGFAFDRVFGPDSCQKEVYNEGVSGIVEDVLLGYNGTIFAYGQTSSGKTHTMEGQLDDDNMKGITPRIIQDIVRLINKLPPHVDVQMKVSYFEVYMDKVRDLLDVSKTNLAVREDKNRAPYVKDITEREVKTASDILSVLKEGQVNRSVAVTHMNLRSSRSHSVFLLQVKQYNSQSEKSLLGKLYLIDLAGSEKVSKSGAEGLTLREAKIINKSLSALGNVISALSTGNKNHVPYRDSKLTRILQESLGGNSRTSVIICCSPSSINEAETKSTLLFGQRAKMIKNNLVVNEELPGDEWKRRYEKERERNAILRKRLAELELGTREKPEAQQQEKSPSSDMEVSVEETIPQTAQQLSTSTPSNNSSLTSHMSLPSLLPHATDGLCEECLKYKHDIYNLYQQLDDKEDELDERSREILSLESQVRDLERDQETLHQNTSVISTEYHDLESKYQDAQDELKSMLTAIDELSRCYQEKDSQVASALREVVTLTSHKENLQAELDRTKSELTDTKLRHNKHKRETLNMFLSLFSDLHDRTGLSGSNVAGVLQRSGLYQSSPNLNIEMMGESYHGGLTSSFSAHSGLSQYDSKTDLSDSNHSTMTASSEYSSELPSPELHSPPTMSTSANSMGLGSVGFQDKVSELRTRVGELLERDYNILSDTTNYVRNVRMKRNRPKTGRVFTVLSRARGVGNNHDNFIPIQLGRKHV